MVGARTATAKRAVPERSSTEIFAIRITSSRLPSTTDCTECPTSFASIPIQTISPIPRSHQFFQRFTRGVARACRGAARSAW